MSEMFPPRLPPLPQTPIAQLASVDAALALIAAWQSAATLRGQALRTPPLVPTSCCGRGCQGCVWEGYYAALRYWLNDAAEALQELQCAHSPPL